VSSCCRQQIRELEDSKEELQQALQQQATLTAEVAMLEMDYNKMAAAAERAVQLQEDLGKLQVTSGSIFSSACISRSVWPATCMNPVVHHIST